MKTRINVVLGICALLLLFICWRSIQDDIDFKAEVTVRENAVKARLLQIKAAEEELDDDAESIITNERYLYIASILKGCYKKKSAGKLTVSDKVDKIVTNRFLALPMVYHESA